MVLLASGRANSKPGTGPGSPAAAATATPLCRRVQDLVDRRFNRVRYDAARTVESFAVRLREPMLACNPTPRRC
jgi:hypothetical protein